VWSRWKDLSLFSKGNFDLKDQKYKNNMLEKQNILATLTWSALMRLASPIGSIRQLSIVPASCLSSLFVLQLPAVWSVLL